MFIHIPQVLNPDQLHTIDKALDEAAFVDGNYSASAAAKAVKNNLQLDRENTEQRQVLEQTIMQAVSGNQLVGAALMPRRFVPPTFSRYEEGMTYGFHTDSPIMGENPAVRTDMAMTIFLSDPASYEGGELVIDSPTGRVAYKLNKGDAIVYPTNYLHAVAEVRSGVRHVAVTWIQSAIQNHSQRETLFNLNQIYAMLASRDQHSREAVLLLQTYSNLVRMWADV